MWAKAINLETVEKTAWSQAELGEFSSSEAGETPTLFCLGSISGAPVPHALAFSPHLPQRLQEEFPFGAERRLSSAVSLSPRGALRGKTPRLPPREEEC